MGAELMEQNIRNHIVEANDNLCIESKTKGVTIYGNIADYLEDNTPVIDAAADAIGEYFSKKNSIRITREYEANSTFFEKYFKNDIVRMADMEHKREFQTNLIMIGTQSIIKGVNYAAKKILSNIDEKKIKDSIWSLCVKYAKKITGNDWCEYPRVYAQLVHIQGQLYGKTNMDLDLATVDYNTELYLPRERYQQENIALILYLLYNQKHFSHYHYQDREDDMEVLLCMWEIVGIFGMEARLLFEKYEKMSWGNAWEMGRLSVVTQSIYHNLTLTIPNINMKKAKEVNKKLMLYVPNAQKQLMMQRTAKLVAKGTIIAASTVGGISTDNPVLLEIAATTATSLFKDLEDTERIGNCLKDCGINEDSVKKCIEGAKISQEKLQAEI